MAVGCPLGGGTMEHPERRATPFLNFLSDSNDVARVTRRRRGEVATPRHFRASAILYGARRSRHPRADARSVPPPSVEGGSEKRK